MLVETVIEHLQGKLINTQVFEKVYSLVEIMTESQDSKRQPHEYISKGVYKPIKISAFNGMCYFRKNGEISGADGSASALTACVNLISVTIPLRIVAFKKKNQLPDDCKFSDDWLAEQIIPVITMKNGSLRKFLKAQSVSVNFSSYNTDSASVWNEEQNTDDQKDVNTDIACVAINILVSIMIDRECFNNACSPYGSAIACLPPATSPSPLSCFGDTWFITTFDTSEYSIGVLLGMTIVGVSYGGFNLVPSQYSLTGILFKLIFADTDAINFLNNDGKIAGGDYVKIIFKKT